MTRQVVLASASIVSRPSPLLGFNNNLRYKGQVFHVQTEDSGVRHPHVITHLFMDGGRILKTTKTSYADHVGTPGYADHVKALMKEQHKAMFRLLKAGDLDELIAQKSGRATGAVENPPESSPKPSPEPGAAPEADKVDAPAAAIDEAVARAAAVTQARPAVEASAAPPEEEEELTSSEIRLNEALERAADESSGVRPALRVDDLPPPPSVGAARSELSGYRVVSNEPRPRPVSERPGAKRVSERPASKRPKPQPPSSSKFSVGRPAATFGKQTSFFGGDDAASEQSLDDVILGYLADDLEPSKKP